MLNYQKQTTRRLPGTKIYKGCLGFTFYLFKFTT